MPMLSSGARFLSAKTCQTGDILTFKNAGEYVDGKFLNPPTFADGKPNPLAGQPKKELRFEVSVNGVDMIFTANKTNQVILSEAFGRNTDDWVGKKCGITVGKVNVGGQVKDSVMLTPIKTKAEPRAEQKDEWPE